MPGWWIWYPYINPVFWSVWGLIASQVGDEQNSYVLLPGGDRPSVASYVRDNFGYRWGCLETLTPQLLLLPVFVSKAVWQSRTTDVVHSAQPPQSALQYSCIGLPAVDCLLCVCRHEWLGYVVIILIGWVGVFW